MLSEQALGTSFHFRRRGDTGTTGSCSIREPKTDIMKPDYYPETDSLYIDLSSRPSVESQEVSEGVILDYDADGNIVGIDIDHASRKLDLSEVVTDHIPVPKTA